MGPLGLVLGVLNFLCVLCLKLSCFVFFQTSGSEPLVLECNSEKTASFLWNLGFWISDSVFFRTCLLGSKLFRICNFGAFYLVITFELEALGFEWEAVLTFSDSDTKWIFSPSLVLSEQGFRITSPELPHVKPIPFLLFLKVRKTTRRGVWIVFSKTSSFLTFWRTVLRFRVWSSLLEQRVFLKITS